MSYVHFLDVFDPAGLPAGLSDRDAAEQARGLRLAEPSPRLLELLTRIRQQPPGITVNVVGGKDQQPVEWVAGEPPRVQGEGAACALWTLILPVDEDMEELQEAVPQIEAWAEALGLSVFDEVQESFARPVPKPPPATAPLADGQELPASGDIAIFEAKNWFWPISEKIRIHGWTVRQSVLACLQHDFSRQQSTVYHHTPSLQRLLVRLLQMFPFETHGKTLWCDRNPLTDPVFKSPGLRLIRVAPEYRIEVLKRLLPLARELFLTVAVPEMELFVERTRDPSDFRSTHFFDVERLDPDWSKHRLTPKQREKQLFRALSETLVPHGFVHTPEKSFPNTFVRLLRLGGGQQMIRFGGHLDAYVQSERMQSVMHDCGWKSDLTDATVVSIDQSQLARLNQTQGCVWGGGSDSPEEIAWAMEDIQRLLLPVLDRLHTAQDLWDWLSQPTILPGGHLSPGFSDLRRLKEWSHSGQNFFHLRIPIYAARCLPDDAFLPLVRIYREAVEDGILRYPNHVSVKSWMKRVEAYGRMPRTPPDAPL